MARPKADKVYKYPTRLSQETGDEVYAEAQKDRAKLGRPVPLGEVLDRAWAAYKGRPEPEPSPAEPESVQHLKEMLGDPEMGPLAENSVAAIYNVFILKRGVK